MTKFGDLINVEVPVLIIFYDRHTSTTKNIDDILTKVADEVKQNCKIIKIDIENNQSLFKALRIKKVPTLMLYDKGEMVWRNDSKVEVNGLVNLIKHYALEEL